jgi:hypothetical protein
LNEPGGELPLSLQVIDHQLALAAVDLTSTNDYKEAIYCLWQHDAK